MLNLPYIGKISVMFSSGTSVCLSRFILGLKKTQVYSFGIDSYKRRPSVAILTLVDALYLRFRVSLCPSIMKVGGMTRGANFLPSVVISMAKLVVNLVWRPMSCHIKICKTMSVPCFPVNADRAVSIGANVSCLLPLFRSGGSVHFPSENTSFRVIFYDFSQKIRSKVFSVFHVIYPPGAVAYYFIRGGANAQRV